MARKTVIRCDRCGDLIEKDSYKINIVQPMRDWPDDIRKVRTEYDKLDLCEYCIEELLDVIGDFVDPNQEVSEL